MGLTNATCATCPMGDRFEDAAGKAFLYCSARPPESEDRGVARWIRVMPTYWCGEHPTRRAAAQLTFEAELERLRKEQGDV